MTDQFNIRMGRDKPPPSLSGKAPGPFRKGGSISKGLLAAQRDLEGGDGDAALRTLKALIENNPAHPHVLIHYARAQAATGDMDGAVETFYRAKEHSGNSPTVDLFFGQTLLEQGFLTGAEEAIRRCLKAESGNSLAANLLALCLFRQGKYREAFREWKKAGWSHNTGFLIEFTIAFERFLLEAPEAPEPQLPAEYGAAAGMLSAGRPAGFLAETRHKWQVSRMARRTEGLLTSQKTLEAWALTVEGLKMQPDDPELTLLQAVALYELGRYAEAGSLLLKILPHDESNLPRCFFAYCLLRMGSVEIAEEILKKISIEGPYDYYLHYHLGLCRLIQGDLRESRRYFGIAYRDFFIDSREYCFEYLIQKVRAAVERLKTGAKTQ